MSRRLATRIPVASAPLHRLRRIALAAAVVVVVVVSSVEAQDQKCQLCSQGSTMADTSKTIVAVDFQSCGEIDELLAPLPQASCSNSIQVLEGNSVDFRAYCECSGHEGPGICNLCGEGETVVDDGRVMEMLGGYTCRQIADLAAASRDENTCSEISEARQFCCQAGGTTPPDESDDAAMDGITTPPGGGVCSLCENGGALSNGDRQIFLLDDISCTDYDLALQWYAVYPFCDIFPFFDTKAYCGCEGTELPNTCEFCEVTEPDTEVYIAAFNKTLTCLEVETMATYATDEDLCIVFETFESTCCSGSGGGGDGAIASTSSPSVRGGGSSMNQPPESTSDAGQSSEGQQASGATSHSYFVSVRPWIAVPLSLLISFLMLRQ